LPHRRQQLRVGRSGVLDPEDSSATIEAISRESGFDETPTGSSFVGGIIVMTAVAAHLWYSSRSQIIATAE